MWNQKYKPPITIEEFNEKRNLDPKKIRKDLKNEQGRVRRLEERLSLLEKYLDVEYITQGRYQKKEKDGND